MTIILETKSMKQFILSIDSGVKLPELNHRKALAIMTELLPLPISGYGSVAARGADAP
jgi:hypothetical protein